MTQTTAPTPISESQVRFANELVDERVTDPAEAAQYRVFLLTATTKSAHEVIDHLLAINAPVPAAYQGPPAERVIISKYASKAGKGCGVCGHPTFAGQAHASVVAKVWSSYHFAGECPEGEVQTSGIDFRVACETFGRHSNYSGKDTYTLRLADPVHADGQVSGETRLKVKVSYNQTTGWVDVTDDAEYGRGKQYGSQRPGAEYVGDASDTLARMLADVQASAAAYGQITSVCGCCYRKLEDALSVERGIGPICWAKFN